jgi:hypothetical protein
LLAYWTVCVCCVHWTVCVCCVRVCRYESQAQLRSKLKIVLVEGSEGFAFA